MFQKQKSTIIAQCTMQYECHKHKQCTVCLSVCLCGLGYFIVCHLNWPQNEKSGLTTIKANTNNAKKNKRKKKKSKKKKDLKRTWHFQHHKVNFFAYFQIKIQQPYQ